MSNFTYEIDERNLRLQMKEFTVPVKEDAWQKFEAASGETHQSNREGGFKGINLNINRNVVLPSVFAVIIILFSFLLVNFVSIKASPKEAKAELKSPPPEQASSEAPAKEKVTPAQAIVPKQEVTQEVVPAVAEIKQEEIPPVKVPETTPEPESTQATATPADPSSDSVASEELKAKRRAERRAARAEARRLEEMKPAPVAEDSNTEDVRPE